MRKRVKLDIDQPMSILSDQSPFPILAAAARAAQSTAEALGNADEANFTKELVSKLLNVLESE
jgi:hypothetical protein